MSKSSKEDTFVNIMYALSQALESLYYEDCITVTVSQYSVIRDWIDGVINGLRPDSNSKFSYRIRFVDRFGSNTGRINISLSLLDNNCDVFNIGFMSDWKLDTDEMKLSVNNYSRFRTKIIFKEKKEFNVFDENLFTDLTQMIKRLVRNSIKKLG